MQQIHWYQHTLGGAVHGFTHPLPAEIEAQVAAGKLRPCPEPAHTPSLELSDAQVAELTAADMKESREAKRARLLAELAELGDDQDEDDVPEDVSPPESSRADELPGGDTLSTPTPR